MKLIRNRWIIPFASTLLGLALAIWTVKGLASATFLTSASTGEVEAATQQAMTEAKLTAIKDKRGVKLSLDEMKRQLSVSTVKADEVVVSFDYSETLAARQVVVDLVQAIGDTGKVPILAMELGKKKPQPSPVRIAIGMVAGFLLGFTLRQFVVARLDAAK
jgi:hypothetical protein